MERRLDTHWRPILALEEAVEQLCAEENAHVYSMEDREALVWSQGWLRRKDWRVTVDNEGEVTIEEL